MPKLVGFAPDLDPRTPGIFLSCNNIIPTVKGFKPIESLAVYASGLGATAKGTFLARYLDGSVRIIAGTATKLWARSGSAWVDISGGQTFTLGAEDRWRFAQFGNDVIATWRSRSGVVPGANDVPQVASGPSGSFGPLGGSPPKGMFVEVANNFVFLLNTDSKGNQYAASGIGAANTWTPDLATQAVRDDLDETPGNITGGRVLGTELVVYKEFSMFLLRYVGPPVIWEAVQASREVGTLSHEGVVDIGDRHVFPSRQDFYTFDGSSRPQILQTTLREFFFRDDLDRNYAHKIIGRWDRKNDVVFWHYPSRSASPAGTIDKWIAWHRLANTWTQGNQIIEDAILPELVTLGGLTYGGFSTTYTSYNNAALASLQYSDASLAQTGSLAQGVFQTDHTLYSYTGAGAAGFFETGDYGDPVRFTMLRRVKPQFADYPAPGNLPTLLNKYMTNLGDTITSGATRTLAKQGWWNVRRAGRFHRFRVDLSGDWEIMDLEPEFRAAGVR